MSKNTVELIRAHLKGEIDQADEYFAKVVEDSFSGRFGSTTVEKDLVCEGVKSAKTFKGLTGKELLAIETDVNLMAEIGGEMVSITPRTTPFANQAEISSPEDATFVGVRTRSMQDEVLVEI